MSGECLNSGADDIASCVLETAKVHNAFLPTVAGCSETQKKALVLTGKKAYESPKQAAPGPPGPPAPPGPPEDLTVEQVLERFAVDLKIAAPQEIVYKAHRRCLEGGFAIKKATKPPPDYDDIMAVCWTMVGLATLGTIFLFVYRIVVGRDDRFVYTIDVSLIALVVFLIFIILVSVQVKTAAERKSLIRGVSEDESCGKNERLRPQLVTIMLYTNGIAPRVLVPLLDRMLQHVQSTRGMLNRLSAKSGRTSINLFEDFEKSSVYVQLAILADMNTQFKALFLPYMGIDRTDGIDEVMGLRSRTGILNMLMVALTLAFAEIFAVGVMLRRWIPDTLHERHEILDKLKEHLDGLGGAPKPGDSKGQAGGGKAPPPIAIGEGGKGLGTPSTVKPAPIPEATPDEAREMDDLQRNAAEGLKTNNTTTPPTVPTAKMQAEIPKGDTDGVAKNNDKGGEDQENDLGNTALDARMLVEAARGFLEKYNQTGRLSWGVLTFISLLILPFLLVVTVGSIGNKLANDRPRWVMGIDTLQEVLVDVHSRKDGQFEKAQMLNLLGEIEVKLRTCMADVRLMGVPTSHTAASGYKAMLIAPGVFLAFMILALAHAPWRIAVFGGTPLWAFVYWALVVVLSTWMLLALMLHEFLFPV